MSDEPNAPVGGEQAVRRTPWGLLGAIGGFVLAYAVAELAGTPYFLLAAGLQKRDNLAFEIFGYQFLTLGVVVAAVALLFYRHRGGLETLGFRFPGWLTLLKAAASVPVLLLAIAGFIALFNFVLPGFHIEGNSQDVLNPHSEHVGLGEELITLIWVAIEVPLTEETLFRGIMYQGMRQFFCRWLPERGAIAAGAVLSGLIFGAAHLEPHTLPILVLLGIWLALVFQYGRSVFASAVVHGLINALAIISTLQN